jgi:hypothetical protein
MVRGPWAWSRRPGRDAHAWLPADVTVPGRTVEIGYFGQRVPEPVTGEPLCGLAITRVRG